MTKGEIDCLFVLGGSLSVYLIDEGIGCEGMTVSDPTDAQLSCNLPGASFSNRPQTPVHFPVTLASILGSIFSLTVADDFLALGVLLYVLFELPPVLGFYTTVYTTESKPPCS